MYPASSAYDRAITVFSPEGRLYQVEYATEAVRHGPLAVGVKATDGVVLAGEKRAPHEMADLTSLKKILLIDDHIGTAIAGLHADARKLIDQARIKSQINRLSYDEPILIRSLVVDIADTKQAYTQFGGARPFGVALIVGGIDDQGPQLYTTDPSGSFWGWKATAIGKDYEVVRDFLLSKWKPTMKIDDAQALAIEALLHSRGETADFDPAKKAETVEVGLISAKDKKFKVLSYDEVVAAISPPSQ